MTPLDLKALWERLKGYKTYFTAGMMAMYAVSGWATGHMGIDEAIMILLNAAGVAGLRHGLGGHLTEMLTQFQQLLPLLDKLQEVQAALQEKPKPPEETDTGGSGDQ